MVVVVAASNPLAYLAYLLSVLSDGRDALRLIAMDDEEPYQPQTLADLLYPAPGEDKGTYPPSVATSQYLIRLSQLSLDSLYSEPAHVASELASVESELVNLCFREYSTFISVHQCSSAVSSAFDDFELSLGRLIDAVPALEDECRQFAKKTGGIQRARSKAALVQENQDRLLDLFELPQLMETCVRNGYYHEAMELSRHVEKISDGSQVALVQDVAREIEWVLQLMTAQLLELLREPVKLPTLIKAVNYLRRAGDINDDEMELVFLTSRLHNFRNQLTGIERDRGEPARYLRRYVDLFRENVYDIISQTTAIFPSLEQGRLASFTSLCVDDLVNLVASYIPRIAADPAAISSISVQLGYCSLSFARVGLDFTALFLEPFGQVILSSYARSVTQASDAICDVLHGAITNGRSPSSFVASPDEVLRILPDPNSPPNRPPASSTLVPPPNMSCYPLVAEFTNSHFTSLNSLRLLAPLALASQLATIQSHSLSAATQSVLDYVHQAIDLGEQHESRPRHVRTPSSPRAHLLRRNTETQMSHEARLARKKEAQRVCVAFADMWLMGMDLVQRALSAVYEEVNLEFTDDLRTVLGRLHHWIDLHCERTESSQDLADGVKGEEDQDLESGTNRTVGSGEATTGMTEMASEMDTRSEPQSYVSTSTSVATTTEGPQNDAPDSESIINKEVLLDPAVKVDVDSSAAVAQAAEVAGHGVVVGGVVHSSVLGQEANDSDVEMPARLDTSTATNENALTSGNDDERLRGDALAGLQGGANILDQRAKHKKRNRKGKR